MTMYLGVRREEQRHNVGTGSPTLLEPKIHLLTPAVAKSATCLAESAAEEGLTGNTGSRARRSRTWHSDALGQSEVLRNVASIDITRNRTKSPLRTSL